MNRSSPKETLEKADPKKEQSYMKYPGEELVPNYKSSSEEDVEIDKEFTKRKFQEKNYKKFSSVHTHPHYGSEPFSAIPSGRDLKNFYLDIRRKSLVIAQRDVDTGKLQGYFYLLRDNGENIHPSLLPKRDKELKDEEEIIDKDLEDFSRYENTLIEKGPSKGYPELVDLAKNHNWKIRFVPSKGNYFSKKIGSFQKEKGLAKLVTSLIITFSILTIPLFQPQLTGFITNDAAKQIGGIYLPIAIIFSLIILAFYFIRKN